MAREKFSDTSSEGRNGRNDPSRGRKRSRLGLGQIRLGLVVRAVLLVAVEDGVGVRLVLVLILVLDGGRHGRRHRSRLEQLPQAEQFGRRLRLRQDARLHHPAHGGDLHHVVVPEQADALAVVGALTLDRRVGDDRHLRAVGRVLVELGGHHVADLVAGDAGADDQFEHTVAGRGARLGDLDDEATVAGLRMERGVALADEVGVVGVLHATALARGRRRLLEGLEAAVAVDDEAVTDLLGRIEQRVERRDGTGEAALTLLAPHLIDGPARERQVVLGREARRLTEPGEDGGLEHLLVGVVGRRLGRLPEGHVGRHGNSCCLGRGLTWLVGLRPTPKQRIAHPPVLSSLKSRTLGAAFSARG